MDFNIIAPDKDGDAGIVWIHQDPENRLLIPAQNTFGGGGSMGNWILNFDFFATWVMGLMQHSIMKHLLLGRGNAGVIEVLEISPRQSTWTLFNFWNLLFWALSRPRPKFSPWILNVKSGMQSFLKTSRLSSLSISQPIQQSREGWRQRWHQPSRHTGQYLGQEGLEPWDRLQL